MNSYIQSDELAELAFQVMDEHPDVSWIRENLDVSIGYLRSDKLKISKGRLVLGECIVVKEVYRWCCPYDFLIVIYGPNTAGMTEEQMKILLYHELLHVQVDYDRNGNPVYKTNPHDVEDFRVILDRYGMDWARTAMSE